MTYGLRQRGYMYVNHGTLCVVADIPFRIMMMQKSFLPMLFNMSVRASRSGLQQPTLNKMLNRRNVSCVKVHNFPFSPPRFTYMTCSTREYSQLCSVVEGNCQSRRISYGRSHTPLPRRGGDTTFRRALACSCPSRNP